MEAPNGAAALEILDRGEHSDLLFTDIMMPGNINGRQLADEPSPRRPGLRVLFTTGYTRNAIVHHGVASTQVCTMIGKPFSKNWARRCGGFSTPGALGAWAPLGRERDLQSLGSSEHGCAHGRA